MGNLVHWLNDNTRGTNSVCELGAGTFANFPFYLTKRKIGIELIKEYLDNKQVGPDQFDLAIHGDATKFEELLPPGETPEVFVMIDFIEHLDKDVALDLIKRIQNVAKKILIFTPHGTHNQTGEESYDFGNASLRTKLDEDAKIRAIEAQRHKSKWYADDLQKLGFVVNVDSAHHPKVIWSMKHLIGDDGGAVMWAVWNRSV